MEPTDVPVDRERRALARRVGGRCRLTGRFTLRSGQMSSTYFDKYLFESDPALLADVATHMARLVPEGTDVLAGLELGGVPVVTAISLATGIPAAFVRKEAKVYGTAKLVEGAPIDGRRVVIVEDVITTGGQVAVSTVALRAAGAVVGTALCVVDRSRGVRPELDALGCAVISLLDEDELGPA